jgi:hypothetical protein
VKRRSVIFLVAGLLLVGAAAAWLVLRPREPEYAGRTLNEWLYNEDPGFIWIPNDVYGHIHDEFQDQLESGNPWPPASGYRSWYIPEESPKGEALLHVGTNALPWLVGWMASKPRPLERFRDWVRTRFAVPIFNPEGLSPAERRHVAAFEGFVALGPRAEPALPALSNLLQQPHPDLQLGWAIACIGPRGIAILTSALTNSDTGIRDTAALSLGLEGSAATSSVPTLLSLIDHGAASYHVLGALGRIGCDPALAAPVLTRNLERLVHHQGDDGFSMTVLILGLCGDRARPAVPLLLQFHEQSDDWARKTIRAALNRIDPAEAAKLSSADALSSPDNEARQP